MDGASIALILVTASLGCVATEALSWFFVYRTSAFKRASDLLIKSQTASERLAALGQSKAKAKEAKRAAAAVNDSNTRLRMFKFRTSILTTIALLGLYQLLNASLKGKVLGRLPFEPPRLMRGLTHRGLEGEDYTQFGMPFIYTLSSIAIRVSIVKAMNLGPSRALQRQQAASLMGGDDGKPKLA